MSGAAFLRGFVRGWRLERARLARLRALGDAARLHERPGQFWVEPDLDGPVLETLVEAESECDDSHMVVEEGELDTLWVSDDEDVPLAVAWQLMDAADERGMLTDPVYATVGLSGRLRRMDAEPAWEPDQCVFCLERARTMVILESGRHAVMMCDDCMNDDAALLDDVDPARIMLLFVAHLN